MQEVDRFQDLDPEFTDRVQRIIWATVATVDRKGRPRSRLLHPLWEGQTGWIVTYRETLKAKHLEHTPYVSLTYWDPQHELVYVDAHATWLDDPEERRRVWNLFRETPEPYGYDPGLIFSSPDDPAVGILRLDPWRAAITAMTPTGTPVQKTWHAPQS